LNERILQPGEEPLDADLVFAASGCAFAAQRSLERERHPARAPRPLVAGRGEITARDGTFTWPLWLRSLRDRSDWVGHPGQRALMAAKYLVRAACLPDQHGDFLAFLDAHPLLRACVRADPRLQERHLHRFINRHWHRATRLQSLQCHYRHMIERLPASVFEAVYARGRATLGELTLKDGSRLLLHLRPPIYMGCEGELCLELSDTDGHSLYRLVLTIIDDRPTMAIGCIQGPVGDQARDRVRELTRNLHGMRPKQLMLVLAYAFAGQCGVKRILAVSNAAHPLRDRRRFQADYDTFWQEQGGVKIDDDWFLLPATLHQRTVAEVESRHRATFRRRSELRWQAVQLLNNALYQVPWWFDAVAANDSALRSLDSLPQSFREASWTS
jgi:uncharacterized protein VirK/YbjX